MSVEEGRPEAGELIERIKEQEAKELHEIDEDLERVGRMIRQAQEKAKNMYKPDQN